VGLQNTRQTVIKDFEGEKDADAPGNPKADPRERIRRLAMQMPIEIGSTRGTTLKAAAR